MRAALLALLVFTLAACSDLQSVVGPARTRDAGATDGPPDVTLVFDVQPLDIPRITFDIPTVDVPVVVGTTCPDDRFCPRGQRCVGGRCALDPCDTPANVCGADSCGARCVPLRDPCAGVR